MTTMSKRRLKSQRRTCPFKRKLELEDAQQYLLAAQKDTQHYKDPENLELYVCTCCGFLHIGHNKESQKA